MKRVELTQEQRLYLQFLLDTFRAQSQWPTHRQLDLFFYQTDPDLEIEEVWKSLPSASRLTSYLDTNLLDNPASLTLEGIYTLEPDAPEFALFLQILNLCVQSYAVSETVRSEEILLSHPQWNETEVRKMGWLLYGEGRLWHSFSGPGPQSSPWTCTLRRQIRRFHDITTLDAYWEKLNALWPRSPTTHPLSAVPITDDHLRSSFPGNGVDLSTESSVLMQQVTMHPDIRERCWNLYMQGDYDNAIFTATRAIEIAVRRKAQLPNDCVGAKLIAQAFQVDNPILTYSAIKAEQEGMVALLRGIILVYKNPQSHRHVGVQNQSECLSVILMCSNLLYTIDNL